MNEHNNAVRRKRKFNDAKALIEAAQFAREYLLTRPDGAMTDALIKRLDHGLAVAKGERCATR